MEGLAWVNTSESSTSSLASQAEWQTRLLPAPAKQMRLETSRCRHGIPGEQFRRAH